MVAGVFEPVASYLRLVQRQAPTTFVLTVMFSVTGIARRLATGLGGILTR